MTLTTEKVWKAINDDTLFGVLAFVNARGEARSAGIVYVTEGRSLLIASDKDAWKVRHIEANPNVSMTITINKRIPFMPFVKIPDATITFQGKAELLQVHEVDASVTKRLLRGLELEREAVAGTRIIRVVPQGDFVTYGIAMPMSQMRKPEKAIGRAPCATDETISS